MLIRLMRLVATMTLVMVAVAISGACARHVPRSYVVTLENIAVQPVELTVSRGDTIVWKNADFVPHTATARDGSWDSKTIAPGASWRLVVEKPGRQEYYCSFHPTMKGVIEVR